MSFPRKSKMKLTIIVCCCLIGISYGQPSASHYEPTWESLDSRPLPPWYDDAKIGIFVHWGVFSVPSFGSEWFWHSWNNKIPVYIEFMAKNFRPGTTYQDFASLFTAEFYNPRQWGDLFEKAGAKYVVLTSKHHEGFTLWPSKRSWSWNAKDVGPKRDLVGDLASSLRRDHPDIHFGLYHSLFEWFNPLYLYDKDNNFSTSLFVNTKTLPELYELVEAYKPEVIWSDGDGDASDSYWRSKDFLAWLFNDSPVKDSVVVNDRWGKGVACHHGSYYTCQDRFNPGTLQPHKWENCMTLDKGSWGYRRNAKANDYLTIHQLLSTMAETISCGGNLLVNVGPTHDGRIPPITEERLLQMGEWLKLNGEAVYGSRPWVYQNDSYTPSVWYTHSKDVDPCVYAIVINWPQDESLILSRIQATKATKINLLGARNALLNKNTPKGLEIIFPSMSDVTSKWVWVLKMAGIEPRLE